MKSKTMNQITLFVQVIAVYYAIPSHAEVRATCDQNVDVDCPCRDSPKFLGLRWYKMSGETRYAIISTSDNENEKSNFHRPAMFGERNSLHLPRVTPQDSGTYKCIIRAGINRQNKESCTPTPRLNVSNTHVNSSKHVEDLPVMWSVLGYLSVSLVKVLLSCATILVNIFHVFSIAHSCQHLPWKHFTNPHVALETVWASVQLLMLIFSFPLQVIRACHTRVSRSVQQN
ncbi:uncharacterized protein LOC133653043 isoform X2 [Entelurus aequoreus]|uniref:uncharacterized protein LOC133653043 isoform X2 n=1 Tax=Entelurus aequoreus TaxID=161455 RepID=UPI002B1D65CD|nr:uncharacterized protein LOC133653043 isoform X2 [Entelurus aequoreus]